MKKTLTLIICATFLLIPLDAFARDLIIALSPHVTPERAAVQAKSVLQFITGLKVGDRALLIDGDRLTLIGEFKIPEGAAYRNPKSRLAHNGQTVAALRHFVDAASRGRRPAGSVRLPQLLRHVSQNLSYPPQTDLIVIGAPVYVDPDQDGFSMTDKRFPGDGHLFASAGKTPYGAADNTEALSGLRVHMIYAGVPALQDETYRFHVSRFWTLFIERQGGTLVSFVPGLPTLFRRVRENVKAPPHNHKAGETDKLEMIRLQIEEPAQTIFEKPISASPLPQGRARRAGDVQVGISWDCWTCDLDLYATAFPGASLLYFGQTESPQGRYWKDYLDSPAATNGYETIGFTVPLDLRALTLAVNFYSGTAPNGVNGEIRIAVDDDTFAAPFHIAASSGNRGKNMAGIMDTGNAKNAQTLVIDPISVVNLQPIQ